MLDHPIRFDVTDDLRRSRLTVFFRIPLVIPHMVVLAFYGFAAYVLWFVGFWVALVIGRLPSGIHDFLAGFLRYSTRVTAYYGLFANPYPPFSGSPEPPYPVDLVVAPPAKQNRLVTFFRMLLALPAMIIATLLSYVMGAITIVCWFICLFTGRMPEGLEVLGLFCLRYQTQLSAYLLLLTSRYPSLDTGGQIQV